MKLLKLDNDYPMTGGQKGLSTTKVRKNPKPSNRHYSGPRT